MRGFRREKRKAETTPPAAGEMPPGEREHMAAYLEHTRSEEMQEVLAAARTNATAMAVRKALEEGMARCEDSFTWRVELPDKAYGGTVKGRFVRAVRAGVLTLDDLLLLVMTGIGQSLKAQRERPCDCPKCRAARMDVDGGSKRAGYGSRVN